MFKSKKLFTLLPGLLLAVLTLSGCQKDKNVRVLRILNSEDYIYEYEEGDEEYASGEHDFQEDMIDQFIHYWKAKTGEKIEVVYDTFDTNETMFNELQTGKTTYDICIPSDYMVQKLYSNNMLHKLIHEDDIWKNISPFIEDTYGDIKATNLENNIEATMREYSVPYMWGTMGIMYNPSYYAEKLGISEDEVHEIMKDWDSLYGEILKDSFSIKDSVRDTFAVGLIHAYADEISKASSYEELSTIFNRHGQDTIALVKEDLNKLKENAFGFETDSGKTDMTTEKIGANMCWSGDATWAITEARDDDPKTEVVEDKLQLYYSIPTSYKGEEGKSASNLWFDCFCMPKNAKDESNPTPEELAQYELAEGFIEFMCMPEIAAQNCYCVGYTPAVAGDAMLDYMYDCYDVRGVVRDEDGNPVDTSELIEGEDYELYDLSYFYKGSFEEYLDSDAVLYADPDVIGRELSAQYPTIETLDRCAIMENFDEDTTIAILDMWESVRTNALPVWAIVLFIVEGVALLSFVGLLIYRKQSRKRLKKAR